MVAEVATTTIDVPTVKVALVAPAGTVTVAGTLAAALSLARATWAPLVGAGPLNVTVPLEDSTPPTTLAGFRVRDARIGRGAGFIVRVADLVTPP